MKVRLESVERVEKVEGTDLGSLWSSSLGRVHVAKKVRSVPPQITSEGLQRVGKLEGRKISKISIEGRRGLLGGLGIWIWIGCCVFVMHEGWEVAMRRLNSCRLSTQCQHEEVGQAQTCRAALPIHETHRDICIPIGRHVCLLNNVTRVPRQSAQLQAIDGTRRSSRL